MSPERSPLRKTRHGNQSFRKLVKKFNDVGLPFTDDQFRSADTSVFTTTSYKCALDVGRILWKRPKELVKSDQNPEPTITLLPSSKWWSSEELLTSFCFDGPNTWFIAACLALATTRSLLAQLLHLDEEHFRKTGIVKFTIWQFGTSHKIVVDDKLPADSDDQLVFTRSYGTAKTTFWCGLLEKAYAKLYGSYEAMALHGSLASVLADLTSGGSVMTVPIGTESHAEVIGKELGLKSLVIVKTKDFGTKSGAFSLISSRYYLVKHLKKNSSNGTLARIASKASALGGSTSPGDHLSPSSNQPSIQLINTIYEPPRSSANSSFSFSGPKLQELTIPVNELPKHFESLTICRPYATNKDRIHRLSVATTAGLQLIFDVTSTSTEPSTSTTTNNKLTEPALDVTISLAQKSLTNPHPIGFRLHAVELNRRYKVHDFSSINLVASYDPVATRYHNQTVRLPIGRYLLTPIANQEVALMVTICAAAGSSGHGSAGGLSQLSQDMPRYQPISFMAPKYPVAVSRLVIHGVEELEKQDRFGSANPYIILRHAGKVIKSSVQPETLSPQWDNLSAVFYHKKPNTAIQVEVWHRNLLMDYFIGLTRLMPVMNEPTTNTKDDESHIKTSQLVDKKGVNGRPGVLHYELSTFEDLKHF